MFETVAINIGLILGCIAGYILLGLFTSGMINGIYGATYGAHGANRSPAFEVFAFLLWPFVLVWHLAAWVLVKTFGKAWPWIRWVASGIGDVFSSAYRLGGMVGKYMNKTLDPYCLQVDEQDAGPEE